MISSGAFAVFAIYASSACVVRGMVWLPLITVLGITAYGSLMSLVMALVVYLPISQIFLAMPYALGELEVAFLAAAISSVLLYMHSGRASLPLRKEVGAGRMPPSSANGSSAPAG